MDETASKVPVKEEKAPERSTESQAWRPFESLRRDVYRLFEDFDRDLRRPLRRSAFDVEPFWRRQLKWGGALAVDVVETGNAYELAADLPGIDEKNIEVKLAQGGLTIKGEKQEEKEEKKRTTISMNAISAPSSATSRYRRASWRTHREASQEA